ncbi:MAG: hypothetical protein LUC92_09485 [Clostridiales bacterium]|nr:hypothetical protein [Clostridiales bacterium]
MKRILFAVLAAIMILSGVVQTCAYDTYDFINAYKTVGASEVGSQKVAVGGRENTYITANTEKGYLYLVDGNGNKLIDRLFTGIHNGMLFNRYLFVRFYGVDDLSGFAVLTGSEPYTMIQNNNYYYISAKFFRNGYNIVCEKRDESGELKATCYRIDGNYELVGYFDYDKSYALDDYVCSEYAVDKVHKADEAGLLLNPIRQRDLRQNITRYELACTAVQAVLKKSGKDIYTYMSDNNISVNYDKYIDIVSPDVLLAEHLGLITPGEGRYFNPETFATREEAACTFYRLCQLLGVETTERSTAFDDDEQISTSAKSAVYAVSGTRVEDSYIMETGNIADFLPDDTLSIENALISVWRIYDYDNIGVYESERTNEKNIGCGVTLFQNSMNKWGAVGADGKVIVEPLYELAGSDSNKAVDNVFVLSDKRNIFSGRDNTYYVFDTEGNLLKKLHYGSEEMAADGQAYGSTYVRYATGSNLTYWTHYADNTADPAKSEGFAYIKRLMSEKIAATEYDDVRPYNSDGLFTAEIPETGQKVILNQDGTFKEYYTEEETTTE